MDACTDASSHHVNCPHAQVLAEGEVEKLTQRIDDIMLVRHSIVHVTQQLLSIRPPLSCLASKLTITTHRSSTFTRPWLCGVEVLWLHNWLHSATVGVWVVGSWLTCGYSHVVLDSIGQLDNTFLCKRRQAQTQPSSVLFVCKTSVSFHLRVQMRIHAAL
jgi:hypothetical protein